MMKYKYQGLAIAMAMTTSITTGCGSSSAPNNPVPPVNPVGMNPYGQSVGTMGTGGMMGSGQCIPLNQPIGFQAQNITATFQSVYAGTIPMAPSPDTLTRPGQYGQVMLSMGGMISPMAGSIPLRGSKVDGNVTMYVASNGYTAAASGVIQLSPAKLQVIYGLFGLTYPNMSIYGGGIPNIGFPNAGMPFYTPGMSPNQMMAQSPCVSALGISIGYANLVGNLIDAGRIYLFLNGTMHGDYMLM